MDCSFSFCVVTHSSENDKLLYPRKSGQPAEIIATLLAPIPNKSVSVRQFLAVTILFLSLTNRRFGNGKPTHSIEKREKGIKGKRMNDRSKIERNGFFGEKNHTQKSKRSSVSILTCLLRCRPYRQNQRLRRSAESPSESRRERRSRAFGSACSRRSAYSTARRGTPEDTARV